MLGPQLDSLTLLLCISALAFVMAAIARSAAKAMPAHQPGLRAWSRSMLAAGAGLFLFYTRGHSPWFLSFALGNSLVMITAAYGLAAHGRILDARLPRSAIVVPLALGLAGVFSTYIFATSHALAIAAVSAALALLFGATAVLLVRAAFERFRLLTAACAIVTASMSVALVLRVFIIAFGDPADVTPTATATPQVVLFLLGNVYVLTTSLWMLDTAHERQRQAALESSRRDGLTGLYTRMAFFELASQRLGAQRGAGCAVVMVDIDHFKHINDSHGHGAGDAVLAHAARHIANTVRLSDLVGRYGGEEFCILLPLCDAGQAAELAERLVADAARQGVRLKDGTTLRYTLSAGCAATDLPLGTGPATDALGPLLESADQALYRAKHAGRNRAAAAVPAPRATPAVAAA
ncbi:MAG TPA: GGDEF domain-containing protein [Rubrivivax sp.]|nr:GGDEF domain-containing protein [Rubrivivax sp.]HPO18006.1 GGDEF domain-containing protein [Rubrivivax sp.]